MSYIKKIFNKTISDFQISDLVTFFETPQEETSVLEFKSGLVEINKIYKEITAFLNTEGGLIIIGAPHEKTSMIGKKSIVICEGNLTYSKFRSKDWLYQKIASNIIPAPVGLKIFEHLDENGSIFVLDVPQSTTPPHQCLSDGKYYIRLEREAKSAPHGLIQALFQKRRLPQLDAEINITDIDEFSDRVVISIKNRSNVPADKISFIVDIYNAESIESLYEVNRVDDFLGSKHSINGSTNQVLVQVINFQVNLSINHKNDEYIIMVGFWCKDLDFDLKYWTYDPTTQKIIFEDWMVYKKKSLIDEINRVLKI